MQGTTRKTSLKNEAEGMTENSFIKTLKILKLVPQTISHSAKRASKDIRMHY